MGMITPVITNGFRAREIVVNDFQSGDDVVARTCPACLGKTGRSLGQDAPLRPYKCVVCGLVFTHPMPDEDALIAYYQGFSFQRKKVSQLLAQLPAVKRSLTYFAGPPRGTRRFLDYGGASGIYARAAQDLGWVAAVSDYDKSMLSVARDDLKVAHVFTKPESIDGQTYEVIFAFHVIEHWNDIDSHLERLADLVSPGGRLLFATPNARTVEKRVRARHRLEYVRILEMHGVEKSVAERWLAQDDSITCWDPPRHLFAFTPDSARAIGRRLGLATRVWTGYNTSRIFEPRQYGIPTLPMLCSRMVKGLVSLSRSSVLAALRELPMTVRERLGLYWLAFRHPDMGEQLYFEYTKPAI